MKSEHIEKPKTVIDTNTIISAPFSEEGNPAQIFELLLLEEIKNFTSDKITEEIFEVFGRDKIKKIISQKKIDFIINNFRKFSKNIKPSVKLDVVKDDPDDNMIVECAVSAKANYIISGNNHLLDLKEYEDIKIVSPKQFIDIYKRIIEEKF